MKNLFFILSLLLSFTASSQSSAEGDKIIGTWLAGEGKGKILISKYGDKYGGKLVWMREPNDPQGNPKLDDHNPDVSKRKNPRLGINNLLGFTYEGKGKYENGTIYDPQNGKTYKCVMTLKDENTLDVRGYVGFTLIGRTDTWTRVK
jgi:uncharacterized protein (DUF2147 family)